MIGLHRLENYRSYLINFYNTLLGKIDLMYLKVDFWFNQWFKNYECKT